MEPDESEFIEGSRRKRAEPEGGRDSHDSRRRTVRTQGRASKLDQLACTDVALPGTELTRANLTYSIGGADTGGSEADKVLRVVEIDESAIALTGQFAEARRVVLSRDGRVVAAALVEVHSISSMNLEEIFEIPILATRPQQRQLGHGSVCCVRAAPRDAWPRVLPPSHRDHRSPRVCRAVPRLPMRRLTPRGPAHGARTHDPLPLRRGVVHCGGATLLAAHGPARRRARTAPGGRRAASPLAERHSLRLLRDHADGSRAAPHRVRRRDGRRGAAADGGTPGGGGAGADGGACGGGRGLH